MSERQIAADIDISARALREHLAALLPEHMIPNAFVQLSSFPRTPSGKIDRQALPAPEFSANLADNFAAPGTPAEIATAAIWGEVLGATRVGLDDNYFDLGGHSILAMLIVSRLRSHFGVDVPLRYLFEFSTVRELVGQITALVEIRDNALTAKDLGEHVEEGTF